MLGEEGSLRKQPVSFDLSGHGVLVRRLYIVSLALALFGSHTAAAQQVAKANSLRVCVGSIRPRPNADSTASHKDSAFSGSVTINDLVVLLSKDSSEESRVKLTGVPVELEPSKAGYPIPERYKDCDYLIEIGNEEFRDRCTDVAGATISCEERENTAAAWGQDVHLVGQQRVEFWVYRAGTTDSLVHKKATVILHWGTTNEKKQQVSHNLLDEVARQVRDKIQRDVSSRL